MSPRISCTPCLAKQDPTLTPEDTAVSLLGLWLEGPVPAARLAAYYANLCDTHRAAVDRVVREARGEHPPDVVVTPRAHPPPPPLPRRGWPRKPSLVGKEGRREGGKEGRREGGKEGRRGAQAELLSHGSGHKRVTATQRSGVALFMPLLSPAPATWLAYNQAVNALAATRDLRPHERHATRDLARTRDLVAVAGKAAAAALARSR